MEHVMVDLETLGRRAGCVVLSLGAVYFDPLAGELGDELYSVVFVKGQDKFGLHTDPETLAWWMKQSEQARDVLAKSSRLATSERLPRALQIFNDFIEPAGFKNVKIWGNGADFDNAILTACYAAVGSSIPWEFWNNRCYRTLKSLAPSIKMTRAGTYHNALDDAKSQAVHACEVFKKLRG